MGAMGAYRTTCAMAAAVWGVTAILAALVKVIVGIYKGLDW